MPLTSKFGKPTIGGPATLTSTPNGRQPTQPIRRHLSEDTAQENPELDAAEREVETERYQAVYAAAREEGLSQEEAREEARDELGEPMTWKKWAEKYNQAYRSFRGGGSSSGVARNRAYRATTDRYGSGVGLR